jgi:hypothetical protein
MEYPLEHRARTPSELSAEVAIAIDWLRRDGYERAMEILSSVMVDLRLMEVRAPFATAATTTSRPPSRSSHHQRQGASRSPLQPSVM